MSVKLQDMDAFCIVRKGGRRTREGFGFFTSWSQTCSKRLLRLDTLSWCGSFHMSSNCRGFLQSQARFQAPPHLLASAGMHQDWRCVARK